MSDFPAERPVRIATRASQLALWQAKHIADRISEQNANINVEVIHISTQGDRETAAPLWQMGGLGVFTREVQKVVLDGQADLAVHSLKDLPTETTPGLILASVPERADYYDVLVLPATAKLNHDLSNPYISLPNRAVIGTGSIRRRAQINQFRPDLTFIEVRGNVDTRLSKLDRGDCHALILAAAGLNRLELKHRISLKLTPPWMYPAVGQGALGIECREDDTELISLLSKLNHQPTRTAIISERALLNYLRAGCHAPVGIQTEVMDKVLSLKAVILAKDGSRSIYAVEHGDTQDAVGTGQRLAKTLLQYGAEQLLG